MIAATAAAALVRCGSPQEQLEYCGLASRSSRPRLGLPSLPLHLALLAVASQCRPPRASFYSYSIPSLCYFWGPLGLSNPENQKGERERERARARPRKGSCPLPSLALTPVLPHPIVLCVSWILDLVGRGGGGSGSWERLDFSAHGGVA